MGKGSRVRPYNKFRFDKNWERIFGNKVRKGTKSKPTQVHKNKKREEMKNPKDDWRKGTVWAIDEFKL